MLIDITQHFYEIAETSRSINTQSNWHASTFIKTSTSYLTDLNLLGSRLDDLQKSTRSSSRFQTENNNRKISHVKENLKLCQQNIKRLKTAIVDIKSKKKMAEKLKESILITMELKLLQGTFRFKDIHLNYAKKMNKSSKQASNGNQRQINLQESHFLDKPQKDVVQQVASKQYAQIEKSIHQISLMYKQTLNAVRLQELLVDNIEGYIDQTDDYINSGRKNLSQLNSKQQKSRKFIYKVFGILYFIVFVYLVILN